MEDVAEPGGGRSGELNAKQRATLESVAFAGVLLLEYLVVSVGFDLEHVIARGGPWAAADGIRSFGVAGALGAVFAAVTLLLFRPRPEGADGRTPSDRRLPFALAHGGAFCVFVAFTSHLFGEPAAPLLAHPWAYFGLWLLLGGGVVALLARATLGRVAFERPTLGALAFGGALGLVAARLGSLSQDLWDTFSGATFHVSLFLLRVVFADAAGESEQRILGAREFFVQVGAACSGYEGIGIALVFFPTFVWVLRERLRLPRAWLLVPLGVLLVWLGNAARVAAIVAVGALGLPELAVGAFHSRIGWVVLSLVSIGGGLVALRVPYFARGAPRGTEQLENVALPYLLPQVTLLAVALVTGAFSDGLDRLYSLRVFFTGVVLLFFVEKTSFRALPVHFPSVLAGLALGVLWLLTAPGAVVEPTQTLAVMGPLWVVMRCIGAVVVVPLAEELAFRGYLMRRLTGRSFAAVPYEQVSLLAIGVSSIAFGLAHGRFVVGTLAGLLFALLARRVGLGAAVWSHVTANLVIAIWVVVSGDTSHW